MNLCVVASTKAHSTASLLWWAGYVFASGLTEVRIQARNIGLKLPQNLPTFLWASLPSSVTDKGRTRSGEHLALKFALTSGSPRETYVLEFLLGDCLTESWVKRPIL